MATETAAPVTDTTEANDPWTVQSATPTGAITQTAPPEPVESAAAPAEPVEEPAEHAPTPTRDEKGQFAKGGRRHNPYQAVKEATGEAARERDRATKAEQRAAELERQLAERSRQPEPVAAPKEPEKPKEPTYTRPRPVWDDQKYASYEDYTDDIADWRFEQRLEGGDIDARVEARLQQHFARQHAHERRQQIRAAGQQAYPDWDATMDAAKGISFPGDAVEMLPQEAIPHVIYALAKDHDLARRLVALDNPIALGLELAKLLPSAGVVQSPGSTPPARISSAKPPVNRVGGTASAVPVDPDDLEFGPEYIRKGNEADRKRKEANRW